MGSIPLVIITFIGHLYIFWNLSAEMNPLRMGKIGLALSIIGTTFMSIVLYYVRFPNYQIFRIIYFGFMVWFGLFLVCFMVTFLFQMIHLIGLIPINSKPAWIIVVTIIVFAYGVINAMVIRISYKTIKIKDHNLISPVRIAHLTDIHLGSGYRKSYVQRICNKIKELNPDFVAITGDLFDGNIEYEYELLEPFNDLSMPIYFVAGNHDLKYKNEIANVIKKTKMIRLNNSTAIYKNIQIIGFDNEFPPPNLYDKIYKVNLKNGYTNVLLYHAPEFDIEHLEELGISLTLSGHTHAGQIFPVKLYMLLFQDYVSGLYQSDEGNAYLYVSPGIGTTKAQIRLGTRPTIGMITLCNEGGIC